MKHRGETLWISRVLERIQRAKKLLEQEEQAFSFQNMGNRYKIYEEEQVYGGSKQRGLVVYSEQVYACENATLDKNIAKESTADQQDCKKLSSELFTCKDDALKSVEKPGKTMKYH